MNDIETKFFQLNQTELKFNQEQYTFSGWLNKYNIVDKVDDVVKSGAFGDSLQNKKSFPVLFQHSQKDLSSLVGNFTATEKEDGLWMDAKLYAEEDPQVMKLYKAMKEGAIDSLSIGFRISEKENKDGIRYIVKGELIEGSIVYTPANQESLVMSVKNEPTIKDAERALRDVGFSIKQSKTILSKGFKAIRDEEIETENKEELVKLLDNFYTNLKTELSK